MISILIPNIGNYTDLQGRYLTKGLIGGFTTALLMAIMTTEIVNNFSSEVILIKNYLMEIPALLIFIPFLKRIVNNNPIACYRLKGMLSIGGLILLLLTELLGWSKVWYLVDAGICALITLLMLPHGSYYKSAVVNKCKEFSADCGHVQVINSITLMVVGLTIVYLPIPTWALLAVALPLEIWERQLENSCAEEVFR